MEPFVNSEIEQSWVMHAQAKMAAQLIAHFLPNEREMRDFHATLGENVSMSEDAMAKEAVTGEQAMKFINFLTAFFLNDLEAENNDAPPGYLKQKHFFRPNSNYDGANGILLALEQAGISPTACNAFRTLLPAYAGMRLYDNGMTLFYDASGAQFIPPHGKEQVKVLRAQDLDASRAPYLVAKSKEAAIVAHEVAKDEPLCVTGATAMHQWDTSRGGVVYAYASPLLRNPHVAARFKAQGLMTDENDRPNELPFNGNYFVPEIGIDGLRLEIPSAFPGELSVEPTSREGHYRFVTAPLRALQLTEPLLLQNEEEGVFQSGQPGDWVIYDEKSGHARIVSPENEVIRKSDFYLADAEGHLLKAEPIKSGSTLPKSHVERSAGTQNTAQRVA